MELIFKGEPKEIATLVLAVQERQDFELSDGDVWLIKTSDCCPEQSDAIDIKTGGKIAYLRLRYGIFEAYCPDESATEAIYSFQYNRNIGAFPSDKERNIRLNEARSRIIEWYRSLQ